MPRIASRDERGELRRARRAVAVAQHEVRACAAGIVGVRIADGGHRMAVDVPDAPNLRCRPVDLVVERRVIRADTSCRCALALRRPSACARTSARRRARPATGVRCLAASCATRPAEPATDRRASRDRGRRDCDWRRCRRAESWPRSASRRTVARRDRAARRACPRRVARPRAAARGRSRRDSARPEWGESSTSGSAVATGGCST